MSTACCFYLRLFWKLYQRVTDSWLSLRLLLDQWCDLSPEWYIWELYMRSESDKNGDVKLLKQNRYSNRSNFWMTESHSLPLTSETLNSLVGNTFFLAGFTAPSGLVTRVTQLMGANFSLQCSVFIKKEKYEVNFECISVKNTARWRSFLLQPYLIC